MARSSSRQQSKYSNIIDATNKSLGVGSARLASTIGPRTHISSGCLSLDLALGGGWSKGRIHGIFGPRDIGKSTIVGLSAVREAQKAGLDTAWIAVEPGFDPEWARKHGVDTEDLLVIEPDTGEQAFQALYNVVTCDDPLFGLIVFDSIGALLAETEISGKTGNEGKMKQGGQAGLITWGVKRVATPISKRGQVVIMLNQVRDNFASSMGGLKQPGGWAIEHAEETITQLKAGPRETHHMIKQGGAEVQVGQTIVAIVIRNKGKEGSRQRAVFDFYNMEVEGKPFGIDVVGDIINTGMRVGVITLGGAKYYLPGQEKALFKREIAELFAEQPEVLEHTKQAITDAVKGKA